MLCFDLVCKLDREGNTVPTSSGFYVTFTGKHLIAKVPHIGEVETGLYRKVLTACVIVHCCYTSCMLC